jgi:glycosyltransferase involved in cell wall biosynthesis
MKVANAPMTTDLTLLIQTYNRPERILSFVRALQREDLTGIEVVIVDNGSTTDLSELTNEVNSLPGARLVRREKNCLCSNCGNISLELASSPFILNSGDDDVIIPGALQELRAEILRNPNFDVFLTNMDVVDGNGKKFGENYKLGDEELGSPELLLARLLVVNVIAWPSTVFRGNLFKKLPEACFNYRTSLDWAFWILNVPKMRISRTDLRVIEYVRHDHNESAVVQADKQLYESISMRVRALSNPDLRSYLSSLTQDQTDALMNAIVSQSAFNTHSKHNQLLLTLLVQSFSEVNQNNWESYLMGLAMVPWDSKSFEITHHGGGDVNKYWLGYPFALHFDAKSCLRDVSASLIEDLKYRPLKREQSITFTCGCSSIKPDGSVTIECELIKALNLQDLSLLLLQRASDNYRNTDNPSLVGVERTLLFLYRKMRNLLPRKLLYSLQKIRG